MWHNEKTEPVSYLYADYSKTKRRKMDCKGALYKKRLNELLHDALEPESSAVCVTGWVQCTEFLSMYK